MTPELVGAAEALRSYLDRVGFRQLYKFIAGVNRYAVTPAIITRATASEAGQFFAEVLAGAPEMALAQCLLFGRPAERRSLGDAERRAADALVAADLLGDDGGLITAGRYQLISAFGLDLLIDRRIHFGGDVHEIYIGPDSCLMLYYVDAAAIRRQSRALDLCSGTGIGALYLSLFSDHVTATDIGAAPLALIALNRRLNQRDEQVEIRAEDLRDTLNGSERFDVLTCNPPFVAFPPGLRTSLYAHGTDADGLGYMRLLVERSASLLTPGGSAYLVADLVGDASGPYFAAELAAFAAAGGLAIDVYIDNVVAAEHQIEPLAAYLGLLNRDRDRAGIAAQLEEFQRDTLRAERFYLSTLRVRTAAAHPGVRVLRRFEMPRPTVAEETWPSLLAWA